MKVGGGALAVLLALGPSALIPALAPALAEEAPVPAEGTPALVEGTPVPAEDPSALTEETRPDPSYFTGVYERVGRDAATPPGLINDLLRIDPAAEGWGIVIRSCDAMAQQGWPLELRPGAYDEVPNIVEGKDGPFAFWCQYFNDHSNYPVLTCTSEMRARFTLWAVTDDRAAACTP